MQLRYYQEEAILAVYNYFAKASGNPVIAMPTGTGKSVVIAELCRSILHWFPGQRLLMLTHVKELIQQNFDKLLTVWPMAPAGIYSAGLGRREIRPITFAGIGSVHRKPELLGHVDLALIDECHLISPNQATTYRKLLDALLKINPRLKVVGFSATPYRLGQGLLTHDVPQGNGTIRKALFTDICYDITSFESFNRLIAEGFLAPLVTKKTKREIDLSNVGIVAGEYNLQDLQAAVDRDEVTKSAIDEIEKQAGERKRWLVFSIGIDHARHIKEEFLARGYAVECVDNDTEAKERDRIVTWYKSNPDGRIRILVNNRIFTVGFDCPEVDLIATLFATQSPGLWVQTLGRGTRPAPGKADCLVLDFGGNTKRLGPINDPVLPRKKGKTGASVAPVKLCEPCGTYNHASARFCCSCGAEFLQEVKFGTEASSEEVMRLKPADAPNVVVMPVTKVEYSRHVSRHEGKPDSLKVAYWSGPRCFFEYICLEHPGYAGKKARDWWRARSPYEPPISITQALPMVADFVPPSHVRVWENRKPLPQVLDYDFSGTGFEKVENGDRELPF